MTRNIASIIATADDLATELGHTPEAFNAALLRYAVDHAKVHGIKPQQPVKFTKAATFPRGGNCDV